MPPEQLSTYLEIIWHMGVTGTFADKKDERKVAVWGARGVVPQSLVINQREATWDGGLLVLHWALNPGSIL